MQAVTFTAFTKKIAQKETINYLRSTLRTAHTSINAHSHTLYKHMLIIVCRAAAAGPDCGSQTLHAFLFKNTNVVNNENLHFL